jgi:hypothetical protein
VTRWRARPRIWVRCGCLGCSVPLVALAGLIVALVLILAGCGGGTGHASAQPANVRVCQHYARQRAWVKNLTYPTMADALKFVEYVAADDAESSGQLHHDLAAMSAAEAAGRSSYAASGRVLADCEALGVKFGS